MMDIRKECVTLHEEMVFLKKYSSLNFAAHQSFFTTEPLTRLERECEANLELLFPLEEEVTEPISGPQNQNRTDPASSNTSSLGHASHDIYRSTLSAIRTIQGLRISSTYNPLSFAVIFKDQEDERSGAVTAENSPSNNNRAQPSDNDDTADQDDIGSAES
ncbi:hypothetical protein BVRB_2g040290 [Beta vulgaris subsp. vulgaris]|nr:hypothetical protein BVRB_2g040290 [Beta vulgaris subsp. vulgaris]